MDDDMHDAQRWPTPKDSSFPCTQESAQSMESGVSDSQTCKEEELAGVELRLEQMGYKRPFPAPIPIIHERDFPMPEDTQDARTVQEGKRDLEATQDELWTGLGRMKRGGRHFTAMFKGAVEATKAYLTRLEDIHAEKIKPVDGPSFRKEANKLASMRMYLLESLADEAIRKRQRFT